MSADLRIAELLNAKICHDLAGPIGAVNNGVDFLQSDNEILQEKAMNLLIESAQQSIFRLQLLRQAYGNVPEALDADLSSYKEILLNYFAHTKVGLDWDLKEVISHNINISHKLAKVILNITLIAANALMTKGSISIASEINKENFLKFTIKAIGEQIKLNQEDERVLNGKVEIKYLTSKNIQYYYSYKLINELKAKFKILKSENELTLTIEVKKAD